MFDSYTIWKRQVMQLYEKETPTRVFPCDDFKSVKNIFFEEHLLMATSYLWECWSIRLALLWKEYREKLYKFSKLEEKSIILMQKQPPEMVFEKRRS